MKNGTDDYYTNIMIGFQPIAGYDDNMTKGLASAQPYLCLLYTSGDGNMHIQLMRDDMDKKLFGERCPKLMEELYAQAKIMGGQVSGEHGICCLLYTSLSAG